MKAFAQLSPKVEDVDLTISVTMPLREWRRLREQLGHDRHPSWMVSAAIGKALDEVSQRTAGMVEEAIGVDP